MKTILILMDTVRKDCLKTYNYDSDLITTNIDNLAKDSYIFENHCTGSLPCMPARRDLMTGRLDFFERFWGGLEPFDVLLPRELSDNNIPSHIITDHHHYWKYGGEGYLQAFDSYSMIRGQESDAWISHFDHYQVPDDQHGRINKQFAYNHSKVKDISDYPLMQLVSQSIDFLDEHRADENFFLQIEGFDPHEPFVAPEEFLQMYDLPNRNDDYISPIYGKSTDSKDQLDTLTKKYKANLSFADYGIGKIINKLKELGIYDQSNIIFTSDHGFHLGEHNSLGKGITHLYNEVSQIPLFHKFPNQNKSIKVKGATQLIDLMPTLIEMYKLPNIYNFHGQSYYQKLINDQKLEDRVVVSGYHGSSVLISDQNYTYFHPPKQDNSPLFNYTAMPTMIKNMLGSKYNQLQINHLDIQTGRFLVHNNYPVFKFPFNQTHYLSFIQKLQPELYAKEDLRQIKTINDQFIIQKMINKLIKKMKELQVPKEQYIRLSLKDDDA